MCKRKEEKEKWKSLLTSLNSENEEVCTHPLSFPSVGSCHTTNGEPVFLIDVD